MIHEGSFYTILNDRLKTGLKRKANEPAPTEATLFNAFTDNQTYTSKYFKVRRRIPNLNTRPYMLNLFPPELRPVISYTPLPTKNGKSGEEGPPNKKRRTLQISKKHGASLIDRFIKDEEQRAKAREDQDDSDEEERPEGENEEEADDEKPDAVDEEDNWSAVSSDSEESGDDYNAEQYFDNGEDDDMDDGDPDENTY